MDETTTDTTNQPATPTPTTPAGEPVVVPDGTPVPFDPTPNPIELEPSPLIPSEPAQPTPPTETLTPDYIGVPYVEPTPSVQRQPLDNPPPTEVTEAPQLPGGVIERVVEKEVIKEIPKEVIVEKIVEKIVEVEKVVEKIVEVEKLVEVEKIVEKPVEKIVYRDREPAPQVCPPPTQEEIEAIKRDFLIDMSKQGTAKRDEIMALKTDLIMSLFDTKSSITHKDVMEDLDFSSTTATRLLTLLRHENKITLHGTSPHTFTYTKN